jgi:hypothetical protein
MPSGQVAGLIDDLPSCAELISRIMHDAEGRLALLGGLAGREPDGLTGREPDGPAGRGPGGPG